MLAVRDSDTLIPPTFKTSRRLKFVWFCRYTETFLLRDEGAHQAALPRDLTAQLDGVCPTDLPGAIVICCGVAAWLGSVLSPGSAPPSGPSGPSGAVVTPLCSNATSGAHRAGWRGRGGDARNVSRYSCRCSWHRSNDNIIAVKTSVVNIGPGTTLPAPPRPVCAQLAVSG